MKPWFDLLACPECRQPLTQAENGLRCADGHAFALSNGVPRFVPGEEDQRALASVEGAAMVAGYRRPSRFLTGPRRIITSEYFPGKAWRTAKAAVTQRERILVIGSGITRYPNAVHLDLDDFPGVDVVGDAQRLPFADNSFDGVLCEVVLEHVPDAVQVIAEAHRVLAPGGRFFFIVPFLFPFHGHPADFRRWTRLGLAREFAAFDSVEVGIHGGPCSAMVNLLSEWLYVCSGLAWPRGYTLIKGGATALLFPIKFLDLLVNRFPEAHRLAATLYITGARDQA